ncbi:MAG: helix-turn-helix transcriptional regulator [Desulfobacteraceae bacterium]|nr:helix-turn-helix transcriptional regulator [Desulfobacteraceae bacterium]
MNIENTAFSHKLPDKLRRLRQSHGWSQGQLGQKLEINVQLISKYERGVVCPPTPMMVKISSVFNVSLDYLLRDDANTAVNKIKNQDLLGKLEEIENLPEEDQRVLTNLLDAYIKKHKFEVLAQS